MGGTVNLDGEFVLGTVEIDHVPCDPLLSAEFISEELTVFELGPEQPLCSRCVVSEPLAYRLLVCAVEEPCHAWSTTPIPSSSLRRGIWESC